MIFVMPIITAVATATGTAVGRRVLQELVKRVRKEMPQGRFEEENKEQFEQLTVENTQHVSALETRIIATDQALAHLTDRTEEVAAVVQEVLDYIAWLIAEVHKQPFDKAPTMEDRENLAREATKAYYYAGSDEKRQIIWEALNSSFNPKFYKEGLHKILWGVVERLEYPHFRVLKALQDGTYANGILPNTAEDTFFARRLAAENLVLAEELQYPRVKFTPSPIALKLLEFAKPPAPAPTPDTLDKPRRT